MRFRRPRHLRLPGALCGGWTTEESLRQNTIVEIQPGGDTPRVDVQKKTLGFFSPPTLDRVMTLPNSSPLDAGLVRSM